MNKSDTIGAIAPALLKAQGVIGGAHKGASNPFFKSSYADLGSVMEACKEPLLSNGISVLQLVGSDEQGGYLETVLLHESGEYISDRMRLVTTKPNDPQAQGSAISYARRYALQSALFIPAVDDDAEAATDRSPKREEPVRQSYSDDPKEVVCHVGKSTKGLKLRELTADQIKFLADKFVPKTPQDHALKEAALTLKPDEAF